MTTQQLTRRQWNLHQFPRKYQTCGACVGRTFSLNTNSTLTCNNAIIFLTTWTRCTKPTAMWRKTTLHIIWSRACPLLDRSTQLEYFKCKIIWFVDSIQIAWQNYPRSTLALNISRNFNQLNIYIYFPNLFQPTNLMTVANGSEEVHTSHPMPQMEMAVSKRKFFCYFFGAEITLILELTNLGNLPKYAYKGRKHKQGVKCAICNRVCLNSRGLSMHLKMMHAEMLPRVTISQCIHCTQVVHCCSGHCASSLNAAYIYCQFRELSVDFKGTISVVQCHVCKNFFPGGAPTDDD